MPRWIAAVVLCACATAPPPAPRDPPQPTLRLPRHFVPVSYAARLAIDPARPTFDGTIGIEGDLAAPASVIWLHGKRLTVGGAKARRGDELVPLSVSARGEDL